MQKKNYIQQEAMSGKRGGKKAEKISAIISFFSVLVVLFI